MEVRCGTCNKPFRVSDDKITGAGIKFPCTRCGVSVKITRDDFEHYSLSQGAVSALDLFEPKPKTPPAGAPSETEGESLPVAGPEAAVEQPGTAAAPAPPVLPDEQPPVFTEPEPLIPAPAFGDAETITRDVVDQIPVPEPEPEADVQAAEAPLSDETVKLTGVQELQPAGAPDRAPTEAVKPEPVAAPEPEPQPEKQPEAPAPAPKAEQKPAAEEPSREWKPKPQPAAREVQTGNTSAPAGAVKHEATRPAAPAAAPARPVPPAPQKDAPRKSTARPSAQPAPVTKTVQEPISASRDAGAGKQVLIIAAVLVVLGAAAFGFYSFMKPSQDKGGVSASGLVTPEGLTISNAAGSVEPDGDLLITGTVVNATSKDQRSWYIVVDVFDAQGAVLAKLRMLNGKQIYTRQEFDILAKRGKNVQELKAMLLQEQGTVVPARGTVNFEIRYIHPPVGVASFNASLHAFSMVQVRKDIEAEVK